MVSLTRELETIVTEDAAEALMLEAALIRQRQPPFNVLLKDDRQSHYPYVCVTWSKPYPEIFITRFRRRPSSSSSSSSSSLSSWFISSQNTWEVRYLLAKASTLGHGTTS